MGYTYCVFGAGHQGVAAIYDLVKFCEADQVIVCEPSLASAYKAIRRLNKLLGEDGKKVVFVHKHHIKDFDSIDIMISCAPWSANLELTKLAVDAGIPFCDLGGNPETVGKQETLKPASAVVPDCGLSPGISNILAVHLAKKGCDEIKVRCGGLPLTISANELSSGKLNYKLTFDPMGLISEYSGDVPVIINGIIRLIPALSVIEPFTMIHECSPTSNNSLQAVESLLDLGVQNYDYMTIRYNGHWNLVRGWKAAGFLRGNKKMDLHLAEALSNNPELQYDPEKHVDRVFLSVVGKNSGDRVTEDNIKTTKGFEFEVFADPETKFSAMEQMTSWGITMVAHYMVACPESVPKGFVTPERFVPGDWIMNEIQKREGSPE